MDFVETHTTRRGAAPAPHFFLSGSDVHDRVELTEELFEVLKQAAAALAQGRSISILARDQEISTQQAADLLGLSRPTVVKLVDSGDLPARVPGAVRRKLRLADVLDYREQMRTRRTEFIASSFAAYPNEESDELVADLLKKARHTK